MTPPRIHPWTGLIPPLRTGCPQRWRCVIVCQRVLYQRRSMSLESLTTPFNRKELRAAATGNPDLDAEYHLAYIGPLARRIATYKIGAFILAASGAALSPIVATTAELPFMAIPVLLASSLPLFGYHFLTRKYVLSMHIYVPPKSRTDLRTFTTYVNACRPGTILRFRTFRPIFGVRSDIVPIEELKLIKVPGEMQAFEKNVEWTRNGRWWRWGTKAWYVQPGLGGLEMDSFWRRVGMDEAEVKLNRNQAVAKMKELSRKKVEGMADAIQKYQGNGKKKVKRVKKA